MGLAKVQDMYLSGRTVLECGDATATEVDREIMQMLAGFYEESKRILSEHMDALHKIAAHLIEKETITGKEFMEILREVEGGPEKPEAPAKEEGTAASGEEQNAAAIGGQDAQASEQVDVRQSAGVSVPMKEDTPQETPAKQDTAEEAKTTWEEAMAEANIKIPGRDPEDSKE